MGNNQKGKDNRKNHKGNNNKQQYVEGTTEPDIESEKYLIQDLEMDQQFKHRDDHGTDAYSNLHAKPAIDQKLLKNQNYPFLNDKVVMEHFEQSNIEILDVLKYHPGLVVFRGKYENTLLAIKFAHLAALEPNERALQENAYQIRSYVKHQRIIRYFHQGKAMNGALLITVMEFAAKGSLHDILQDNGAFSELLAVCMFNEITKAVDYMHTKKALAHRNLNLEHILVTRHNVPKLTGFKFAVRFDGTKLIDTYCGQAPFLAPEVLKQEEPYDPFKADIWSLGVILFGLANNGLPFQMGRSSQVDVLIKPMLAKQYRWRELVAAELSPEFKQLIGHILEPDLNKRATFKWFKQWEYLKKFARKRKDTPSSSM